MGKVLCTRFIVILAQTLSVIVEWARSGCLNGRWFHISEDCYSHTEMEIAAVIPSASLAAWGSCKWKVCYYRLFTARGGGGGWKRDGWNQQLMAFCCNFQDQNSGKLLRCQYWGVSWITVTSIILTAEKSGSGPAGGWPCRPFFSFSKISRSRAWIGLFLAADTCKRFWLPGEHFVQCSFHVLLPSSR